MRLVRLASLVVSALLASGLVTACGGGDEPSAAKSRASSSAIGERVAAALEADAMFDNVRAVLVSVEGKPVFEKYYDTEPDVHRNIFSVTKSVMSTLVGIAIADGDIPGVDATLAELLPTYAKDMKPTVARTTLEQVLTMQGGFVGEEDPDAFAFIDAEDPTLAILDGASAPGDFVYSDAGAHLVSAILATATGQTVLDYARARLFDPLDIESEPAAEPGASSAGRRTSGSSFTWPVDSQGLHLGWSGLALTPADLAKIGNLYLEHGTRNGAQVVPSAWIDEATTVRVRVPGHPAIDAGYGYEWWAGEDDGNKRYGAVGYGGQRILVAPELGAVVVVVTDADAGDPASGISPLQSAQLAEEALAGVAEE